MTTRTACALSPGEGSGGPQGLQGLRDLEEVGRGGHGIVYRAVQPALNRTVAVKVLDAGLDEKGRRRFQQEVAAMGALSGHPHIAQVHGAGFAEDGSPYLVMPYLPGGSLGEQVRTHGPMPWPEAVEVGVKLCGALASAHAAGLLHRDVKPDNVLRDAFGEPILADFGIAAVIGANATGTSEVTASIAYASPDILNGERPDERDDVYSLAATLHCLVAGQPPFTAEGDATVTAVIARILRDPPPRPQGIPDMLADLLASGLAKAPGDRPTSAADVGAGLRAVQAQAGQPETPLRIAVGAQGTAPPRSAAPAVDPSVGSGMSGPALAALDLTGPTPAGLDVTMSHGRVAPGLSRAPSAAEMTTARPVGEVTGEHAAETPPPAESPRRGSRRALVAMGVMACVVGASIAVVVALASGDRSAPAEVGVLEQLGISGRVFARIQDPASLAAALTDAEFEDAAVLGAWWSLADFCVAEGFERTARCYDLAAELLDGIGVGDPRQIDLAADADRVSVIDEARAGYRRVQEEMGLVVDVPGAADIVRGRPGVGASCDPDCVAVADELRVGGFGNPPTTAEAQEDAVDDDVIAEETAVEEVRPTQAPPSAAPADDTQEQVRLATLVANVATLRTSPEVVPGNEIGRIEGQSGATVERLGEGSNGWYRIRDSNGQEGWLWGAFLTPGVDGLLPASTRNGGDAVLRDQFGAVLGIENQSGDKVLVFERGGDLWSVVLPEGTRAYVSASEMRLL